ncbi:alpha-ketoglutarate-dependent dioxygenase AlkB [Aestuariirhabdus sp. Z084]|uniref:alpha-ketoglutarate-dependent dioxygenase AlkB family protein n=1 Tax=Aestuariirhabdus haliotis TaxID=2918751 RepID=UPI00201B4281|nr:alpha-ketoglutarate-dependent dioxygenase AlkB [Aestuariirhabdus haliotis]MCL6417308.1 alpha-ketoglutarate-dependent dioxygenase AlkB [Aestuariirhabdus haliotis]MCL6421253.1 alpha-ketoglutarate-dependent dioxygenase AlkB [Aestuariirhabdus haliotis]
MSDQKEILDLLQDHNPASMDDPKGLQPNLHMTRIPLQNGELHWYPSFFEGDTADRLMQKFSNGTDWKHDELIMGGRRVPIPRLQAWYGEQGYRYSGLWLEPQPWLSVHLELLDVLQAVLKERFNSVLMNLYRDGNDSVGWHADDEPELGRNPCIASLSLGATRRFHLRHTKDSQQRLSLDLSHGSLLVMSGETQHHWRHQIAKTRRDVGPRINLTFRYVYPGKHL